MSASQVKTCDAEHETFKLTRTNMESSAVPPVANRACSGAFVNASQAEVGLLTAVFLLRCLLSAGVSRSPGLAQLAIFGILH